MLRGKKNTSNYAIIKKITSPPTHSRQSAFTIVELIIIIVIIAILATLSIVAYNGIQHRARSSEASMAVAQAKKKLELYKVDHNGYPETGNLDAAGVIDKDVSYQYTSNGTSYCLTGTVADVAYSVTNTAPPSEGTCGGHNAPSAGGITYMQTVTPSNCPATRTMAVDARDDRTYWVQKLADGKCWMLTNLAYAGGGTNTYGDVKTLTQSNSGTSFTSAYYYVPSGASPTTNPTEPSTSTTGTGQYGYLYNWCGAMGNQATPACASDSSTTPTPNSNISICPSGWRLPTGASGGEFSALNAAVNNGTTTTDSGLLSTWLAQRGGYWNSSFSQQGTNAYYWSSSHSVTSQGFYSGTTVYYRSVSEGYAMQHRSTYVDVADRIAKYRGYAVRCVAS